MTQRRHTLHVFLPTSRSVSCILIFTLYTGNMMQLMNASFLWAVAYLDFSVWLMAASITSLSLFKIHQVSIEKSGSKEELWVWTHSTEREGCIGKFKSSVLALCPVTNCSSTQVNANEVTKLMLYRQNYKQRQLRWNLPQGVES